METTQKIVRIDGTDIHAEEKDVNQAELLFYTENPRIKTIVDTSLGDSPSQEDIEKLMKGMEHVKKLRQSIIAHDGLMDPIIVKDNIVLEGNSRLAAYRLLAASDAVKWGYIRAIVLPSDVTEQNIFSMLGTLHIIGKTPWQPFEQAGYLYRHIRQSRKSIEGIAAELGISATDAKRYVQVYQLMIEHEDVVPTRWSYYFEMFKNPSIKKANENYPQYDIVESIIDMIKEDKFADAREIRKVGTIVSASGENAEDAIRQFIRGEITLEEGLDMVSSESRLTGLQAKAQKIIDILGKEEAAFRDYISDAQLMFKLRKIRLHIDNILDHD